MPGGRKTEYTVAMGEKICGGIAKGMGVTELCEPEDMPTAWTIFKWLRVNEEFASAYARAREASADAGYEKIVELERKVASKDMHPNDARVIIDSIKWRISRIKPKAYGDRSQVDVTGGVEVVHRIIKEEAPEWMLDRLGASAQAKGEARPVEHDAPALAVLPLLELADAGKGKATH